MFPEHDLLREWGVPFTQYGGVTLVERCDAAACVTRIFGGDCRFLGYDAFAVTDYGIQPFLEFSRDWSGGGCPPLNAMLSELQDHPSQITHYEFVFDAA